VHLTPGDPVKLMLGDQGASAEDIERIRHELGLDRPLTVQFISWFTNVLQGDLGTSIRSHRPVVEEIAEMIPSTIQLTLAAEIIAVVFGITMGVLAAVVKQPWLQTGITTVSLIGLSMPVFWSGLIFILFFSLKLDWLPIKGEGLDALILPAVTLGLPALAVITRMTRSSVLEELNRDYIRTARSKGLREHIILIRHALKNAFIPILTIIGLQFGGLLSGAFITETVFARPGLGRFTIKAIMSRDFPQVQGTVLLIALIYVFVNLLTDLTYAVFDPRIRYE
jgi:peptide/nickel transport system permease protein